MSNSERSEESHLLKAVSFKQGHILKFKIQTIQAIPVVLSSNLRV